MTKTGETTSRHLNLPWNALEAAAQTQLLGVSASDATWRMLSLLNEKTASAYLFSASPIRPRIALPVGFHRTLIGRSDINKYVSEIDCLRGMVEGFQWQTVWENGSVQIRDIDSTNGSVLIPKQFRDRVPLTLLVAAKHPDARCLGWDGKKKHEAFLPVSSGDVLVTIYNAFLFCPTKLPSTASVIPTV